MERIGFVPTAGGKKILWLKERQLPNIFTWPIFKFIYPFFGIRIELVPELKKETITRLATACFLYHQRYLDKIFVAGGYSKFRKKPNAVLMKEWLVKNGVPENRVFFDDLSLDTSSNVENFISWLREENCQEKVVFVITSDYHLSRVTYFLVKGGLEEKNILKVPARPPQFESKLQMLGDEYTYNVITERLKMLIMRHSLLLAFLKRQEKKGRESYRVK